MPPAPPPADCPGTPVVSVLAAGQRCYRVHATRNAADTFNATPQPTALSGGRFDSLDGSYAHLYVADTAGGAIAETLCRDLPFDGSPREIPRPLLRGLRLSEVEVAADLDVVLLHGAALNQVGQDLWLTKSEARDYELTRQWAAAIRAWVPDCRGFEYRARHNEDLISWVLFKNSSVTKSAVSVPAVPGLGVDLDSGAGELLVGDVLQAYNATLGRA